MKILLLYREPFNNEITHNVVNGGGEMFCKLINENFDTKVRRIDFEADNKWKGSKKNQEQKDIINQAEDINADVIISNYPNAIYTGRYIQKSPIPVMVILHSVYKMTSIIQRINALKDKKNGHSVFLVSEWQHDRYKELAASIRGSYGTDGGPNGYGNKDIEIDGCLNSSYCKIKKKIVEPVWECGTIGRCDRNKKPFLLRNLLKDTDITNLIISGKYQDKNDKNYYEKNKELDNVLWDRPHDEVIDNLSKFGTYFSTCNHETWGITALEALSCGVPLILNGYKDGTHASTIIPADKSHYKIIPTNDKEELIKAIKSFDKIDRKEIQEKTWEKHNKEKWKNDFQTAIDKTIRRFKRCKKLY